MNVRVFFVSDRTGITAETLGETLLTQFPKFEFQKTTLPFVDSPERAHEAANTIKEAERQGAAVLVFSTLTDETSQKIIAEGTKNVFDLFGTFIGPLEQTLNAHSSHTVGQMHGIRDVGAYEQRIQALNYTLDHDDGMRVRGLDRADIILVGVSRCGKTPTCLYLALQYHLRAANYPLTDDDLDTGTLPEVLQPWRKKLHGLTIQPERLSLIRQERRPHGRYATLQQCRSEVSRAEALYREENLPFLDTSSISIEEIAATLVQRHDLHKPF